MARNPYFPVGRKMCLMGDIKVCVYYSLSGNVHLSDCGIGILVYQNETKNETKKKSALFLYYLFPQ